LVNQRLSYVEATRRRYREFWTAHVQTGTDDSGSGSLPSIRQSPHQP
jgi:hypothetical protein